MSVIRLYKGKSPTYQHRFIDNSSLLLWESHVAANNLYSDIELDGVEQFSTLSFVDITLSSPSSLLSLFVISYVKLTNTSNNSYYAFVDRIEQNECDNALSYRLYYTIDWWTTVLSYGMYPFVTGDTIRAHVNDIENNRPTLKYTTTEMELLPSSFEVVTESLPYPFDSSKLNPYVFYEPAGKNVKLYFYHLIVTAEGISALSHLSPPYSNTTIEFNFINLGASTGAKVSTTLYEIVIPFVITNASGYEISISRIPPITIGSDTNVYDECITPSSFLTDYVVASFFTNFLDDYSYSSQNGITFDSNLFGFSTVSAKVGGGTKYVPLPVRKLSESKYLSLDKIKRITNITTNLDNLTVPTNYTDYKNNLIVKFNSEVYNQVWFNLNGDIYLYNYNWLADNNGLQYNIDYTSGIFSIYYSSLCDKSYSNIYTIDLGFLNPPPVVDNYWDRYNAKVNAIKNIGVFASNAVSLGTSAAKLLYGGLDIATSPTQTDITNASIKTAETGGSIIGSAVNMGISVANYIQNSAYAHGALRKGREVAGLIEEQLFSGFPSLYWNKCNDLELRDNLEFYGYNTHLQPYQILDNHKRVNYNFIKVSNTVVLNDKISGKSFNAEVQNSIASMFNNGVWLHSWRSYDDLFKLEVINYPQGGFV